MNKQIKGSLLLVLAAALWGFAFVTQTTGMDHVGAITFQCLRCVLAGLTMLVVCLIRGKGKWSLKGKGPVIKAGILCGIPLCAATLSQQFALNYTTVAKAGFITSVYVLFVPVLCLFVGKRCGWKVWPCIGMAVVGLYLLSMSESLSLSLGDSLALICALLFAVQIIAVDHFAGNMDPVELNGVQFFTCAVINLPFMFLLESPGWSDLSQAWGAIAYTGIMSGGIGFMLQIVSQRDVKPAVASLIMSLEGAFAALSGWLVLGQGLSLREGIGCVLMFAAIILAQMPDSAQRANGKSE